jgi:hypothetical protein
MQRSNRYTNPLQARERIGATLAIIAILMAGSEGPWFPLPNIIGVGIAIILGVMAARD